MYFERGDFIAKMNNSSNETNLTLECQTPRFIPTNREFLICYAHLFKFNIPLYIFEIVVILGAVILNTLVMISVYFYTVSFTVFDQILIGHCIIQAVTAAVDIPFFHIMDVFGYWPLPHAASMLWAIYDNNINTTTNLTMLYMCWVRLRSIQVPTNFKEELLVKWPKMVMASIWVFGLGIWAIISLTIGTRPNSTRLSYDPEYLEFIFNIVFWLVPLLAIIVLSVKIIIILNIRSLRKMYLSKVGNGGTQVNSTQEGIQGSGFKRTAPHNSTAGATQTTTLRKTADDHPARKKKRIVLTPQMRFMLIILIYWVQWIIPCITVIVDGICSGCVPSSIFVPIYWLTYTVVFTDPLTIIVLHPNLRYCWST